MKTMRWIAETAMIAAEAPSVSRTLVVAPARRGDVVAAVGANVLYDTGRLPWLCPVSLAAAAIGTESCAGEATPEPREQQTVLLEPPHPQDAVLSPRFLDEVLGPDDDIVLFEYVKRDNRETGAALVGIEISSREGYEPLWGRMKASPLKIQLVAPGSTAYRFLV